MSVQAAIEAFITESEGACVYDPYRGKSLRLQLDFAGDIDTVHFEAKPEVKRNDVILPPGVLDSIEDHADVILPPGVLDSIEDHAIEVGKQAERLRAAGQHLKRGLLLYGPPGTCKTLTIKYLASTLQDSTLFVLTGAAKVWLKFVETHAGERRGLFPSGVMVSL